MKTYSGSAKVKENSNWVYKGATLPITEIYFDYKNGNGNGVFPDGSREYRLDITNHPFGIENGYKSTVIHDKDLENIKLFETICLPFDKGEIFDFAEYCQVNVGQTIEYLLDNFIKLHTKPSILPTPDMTTVYDNEEFERRYQSLKDKLGK